MDISFLPDAFLAEMQKLLGTSYGQFLESYEKPRFSGLRVNTLKISAQEFLNMTPFSLRRVLWTSDGFYTDYRDAPARHPHYQAGLYYLQEPSAMAPAELLPVQPGDRVLDLCAAPGGKATELGAKLNGEGLLVANEISASRAKVLLRNVEIFGITNAYVTNTAPARLQERFPEFFDKILVDAPCSGEGMFRKDPEVARAWYSEKSDECAQIQRDIIVRAADMLKAGGVMVYSTCTFEVKENEAVIAHLLAKRPEMELMEIPKTGGRECFSDGFGRTFLESQGYELEGDPDIDLTRTARLWPHLLDGEGHFMALLRKRPDKCPDSAYEHSCQEASGGYVSSSKEGAQQGRRNRKRDTVREERETGRKSTGASRDSRSLGRRDTAGAQELDLIRSFALQFDPEFHIDEHRLEIHGGQAYLMPADLKNNQAAAGISYLRSGLYLGELKKNRFEPAQELAIALHPVTGGEMAKRYVNLSSRDERTGAYLRGEVIEPDEGGENGWRLVCTDGFPLGWGKLVNGRLKNKYLAGWRLG